MPIRVAKTEWSGGLTDGSGKTELVSSGLGSYEVSFPKRSAEQAGGATSPEELIAAAHSACYAMQLSAFLADAGGRPEHLEVTAEVSLSADPAGGFHIPVIALKVRGSVPGIDADGFAKAAEAAKLGCPVSKALAGTKITLDASLS